MKTNTAPVASSLRPLRLPSWLRPWLMLLLCATGWSAAWAESVTITEVATSITGTASNVSGVKFEHDLMPASAITLNTLVAGFTDTSTSKKLANMIKILEDGEVVAILVAPTTDGFANNSVNPIDYTPTTPGVKSLVVQATNGDTTVSSAAIAVYVYGIAIATPVANSSVPAGSDLYVSASSLLRSGIVATVQFLVDGSPIGTDANAPYAVAWRPTATGAHTVSARLTDGSGGTVDSPSLTCTVVTNVSNGTLAVAVTSPTAGRTVAAGTALTLAADASLTGSSGRVEQVQFYVDGVAVGDPDVTFPFSTSWTPTLAGTYAITGVASDDKSNTRVSSAVSVTVTGNVAAVSLTTPDDGISVPAGSGVTLTAVATGQDGTTTSVQSVEFLVDGNVVGSSSASPYTFAWNPTQARTTAFALTARVTATNGSVATSSAVSVTVVGTGGIDAPTVSLSPGTIFSLPGDAYRVVTASTSASSGRTVQQVEFFVDGASVGTDSLAPYNLLLHAPVALGSHRLTARVTDSAGATNETAVSFEVTLAYGGAPTVTAQLPVAGATVAVGTALDLSAVATDSDGTIQSVVFLADNQPVLTCTAVPYAGKFYPTYPGSVTIAVLATDNSGQTALITRTVTVTGQAQGTPTVTLTKPDAASGTVISGQRLIFEAEASSGSSDAWITRVDFLVNSQSLGTAARQMGFGSTYRLSDIVLTEPGTYTIKARVTDSRGVSAESPNSQTLVVQSPNGAAPTVAIVSPSGPTSGGLIVRSLSTIPLVATAADVDGTVSDVEFFVDRGQTATATVQLVGVVTSMSVLEVSVTRAGEGYLVLPRVLISGDGSGAAAVVSSLNDTDGVAGVTVTAGGSGYSAATASFVGGGLFEAQSVGHATKDPGGLGWRLNYQPGLLGTGPYRFYAVARDNSGNQTVSGTVRVVVTGATSLPPTITLANPGATVTTGTSTALTVTASDPDGSVASVEYFANAVSLGQSTVAPFTLSWTATSAGTYLLTAVATDNSGNTTVSNSVTVTASGSGPGGTPPTVAITAPTAATSMPAGATSYVNVTATANGGRTITKVELYFNGALVSTLTTAPYNFVFTAPTTTGTFPLLARAYDSAGATSDAIQSIEITTAVGYAPIAALAAPANGAQLNAGALTTLLASAADADGTIASVQFYVNGAATGTAITAAPYRLDWTPVLAGRYVLEAIATDNNGNSTKSTAATVTVTSATPTVAITTSNGSQSVIAGQPVTITAVATDQTGSTTTVDRVEFYVDGVLISSSQGPTYTATWTPLAARATAYSVTARVVLQNGQIGTSAAVAVTVTANSAPTVSISAPLAGQTFTRGSSIALVANAGDLDGSVASVQFYVNNALLGSAVTTAPYQTTFVPMASGTYVVTAKATDNNGLAAFSSAVSITVKEPVGQSPTAYIGILPDNASSAIEKLFTAGSLISIGVNASDADGTIARVTLFYDGQQVATFDHAPYATTLQLPSSSTTFTQHTISAVVEDNDGNRTNAAEAIVVVSSSRTLPAVTLVTPQAGTVFNYGAAITVEAQLTNSAANVTGVVFAENGVEIQTVTSAPYRITYVPGSSGAKSLMAIAYSNWTWAVETTSGTTVFDVSYNIVTTAGATVNYTVKDFSPTSDTESFVSQTYQDVLLRAASSSEIATSAATITAGSLSRAQLAANLVAGAGFDDGFDALAATWIITGQWPSYTDYAAAVTTLRNGTLSDLCGELLNSNTYLAAYGTIPTVASLTGTNSYAALKTFATHLYQNAYGRDPTLVEIQAIANAPSTSTQAGGITVVGLDKFLAEFVAKNSAVIAARVRTAGLYLGLLRAMPTAAEIVALATQSTTAAAEALLQDAGYAERFLAVSRQPDSLALARGADGLLRVGVSGTGPFGYQWYHNGQIVAGGTRATLPLREASAATAGTYYVLITSPTSRVVSQSAVVTVRDGASRLVNIAARAYAGPGDDALIAGFVLSGSGEKSLLLRGVGPGLVAQGVAAAIADPKLELHSTAATLAINDDWSGSDADALEAAASRVGAFALTRGSKDSALLRLSPGGVYSLLINNASGGPGIGLAEIYDAGTASDSARLVNLSSRARVGTGDQVLIAGFVISGEVSKRVLIRAVGPGLLTQGVVAALAHPRLTLTQAGVSLATDENWSANTDASLIASIGSQVGAFPLVAGSLDAAVILSLPPGVYSAVVSGVDASTGIALVEVYDAD